ncbi:uncharacterized protein LOC125813616 [Solanum verrucosum]|uniref:uncharacterized protein LOC125813616 n=1 Tax=Solanum verrucosum TaxID=315347 RepID=UPI0020D0F382|nr:uncharacterized protein LOC125813616 [Solanum verrucosum]
MRAPRSRLRLEKSGLEAEAPRQAASGRSAGTLRLPRAEEGVRLGAGKRPLGGGRPTPRLVKEAEGSPRSSCPRGSGEGEGLGLRFVAERGGYLEEVGGLPLGGGGGGSSRGGLAPSSGKAGYLDQAVCRLEDASRQAGLQGPRGGRARVSGFKNMIET